MVGEPGRRPVAGDGKGLGPGAVDLSTISREPRVITEKRWLPFLMYAPVKPKAAVLVPCAAIGDTGCLLDLHLDYGILRGSRICRKSHKDLACHSLLHRNSRSRALSLITP